MRRQRNSRTAIIVIFLVAASMTIIALASRRLFSDARYDLPRSDGNARELRDDHDKKPRERSAEARARRATSDIVASTDAAFVAASPPPLVDLVINGKQRGPSRDFVTGDGFRFAADFAFDDTMAALGLSPASVVRDVANCRARSTPTPSTPAFVVVFVQTHMLEHFLDLWLPLAHACPIRLITHNSDYSSPYEVQNPRWKNGQTSAYLRQRRHVLENPDVQLWFAQNAVVTDAKLQPVGIGIENRYNKYGGHVEVYESHRFRSRVVRGSDDGDNGGGRPGGMGKTLLFVSFSVKTNPRERGDALRAAKSTSAFLPTDVTFYHQPPPKKAGPEAYASALHQFLNAMSRHRFVLAPHGHGVDTHRLWEALYVGCIPIVLRGAMDAKLLEELPVLLVSSYADLSRDLLLREEPKLLSRFDDRKRMQLLNMSYWASRLRS